MNLGGRDLPKRREYVGVECGHCGSRNTVIEVFDFCKERYCMTCSRYNTWRVRNGVAYPVRSR